MLAGKLCELTQLHLLWVYIAKQSARWWLSTWQNHLSSWISRFHWFGWKREIPIFVLSMHWKGCHRFDWHQWTIQSWKAMSIASIWFGWLNSLLNFRTDWLLKRWYFRLICALVMQISNITKKNNNNNNMFIVLVLDTTVK